jgi:hypothetical protein
MGVGVYVLGMHRSGTSAAARLVNLLGVPTCVDEDLAVPTVDNPRGYWESASLTAFNDRLLATLGCDWSCPAPLEAGWVADSVLDELRAEAADLFAQVFPPDQWVWKDPRNCVALPFWAHLLDVRPVVVLVHRNPLEIAASLAARDGLGRAYSLALWERYLRLALASISGLPTLVTGYAELLAEPLAWCMRVREFLTEAGIATRPPPEPDALAFIDDGLRHARFTAEELFGDPACSEQQRALFLALEQLSGPHATLSAPTLPPETQSTEALLAERRRAYVLERELTRQYLELEAYARRLGERYIVTSEATSELQEQSQPS